MDGRLEATIVVAVAMVLLAWLGGVVAARRAHDEFSAFHYRRLARYGVVAAGIIVLLFVWRSALGHVAISAASPWRGSRSPSRRRSGRSPAGSTSSPAGSTASVTASSSAG